MPASPSRHIKDLTLQVVLEHERKDSGLVGFRMINMASNVGGQDPRFSIDLLVQ